MRQILGMSLLSVVLGCGPDTANVDMKAVNSSEQSGKAQLIDVPAKSGTTQQLDVQLSISEGVNGFSQFVGIYEGSCASLSGLKRYVALSSNGRVSSQFVIGKVADYRGKNALVVRKDSTETSPVASCGDIR